MYMCVYIAAGSAEFGDLLPHIKGQGAIDLEYESDGELYWL